MKKLILLLLTVSCMSSGCASLTTGQTQQISVETHDLNGKAISGASCKLTNDKGSYFVTTPGTVGIQRSYKDLDVNCTKDQSEPGAGTAKSSTKAMAFGNILFGGIIGAAVDAGTGAAYDYPSMLSIILGRFTALGEKPLAPAQAMPAIQATTATR